MTDNMGQSEATDRPSPVEVVASELALIDGYNPNDYDPSEWPQIREGYEVEATRIVDALGDWWRS